MSLPASIEIVEVGPRDGLQLEPVWLATDRKIALVDALTAAGLRRVEVTSFVSPTAMPQMADADEVMAGVRRRPGVTLSALVPNRRGAERAIAAGADAVRFVFSVTDAANTRNLGKSVSASVDDMRSVLGLARAAGRRAEVILGMSFGCPFTGAVAPDRVVDLAGRALGEGADEVVVADSCGFANPAAVRGMVRTLRLRWPDARLGLHLHDTRGLALANAYAALHAGIDSLDASIGGLGRGGLRGEPAAGNPATEDLVNLCEEIGVATGVDVEALVEVAHLVAEWVGHELPGRIQAAGTRAALFARLAAPGGRS